MEDTYILPGELAILLAFLLLPPLAIAMIGQFWYLGQRGVSTARTWVALLATVLVSSAGTVLLLPFSIPRILGIQNIDIASWQLPVLPLAFIVVALVAWSAAMWACRRA